jgi:hypothetical protein
MLQASQKRKSINEKERKKRLVEAHLSIRLFGGGVWMGMGIEIRDIQFYPSVLYTLFNPSHSFISLFLSHHLYPIIQTPGESLRHYRNSLLNQKIAPNDAVSSQW